LIQTVFYLALRWKVWGFRNRLRYRSIVLLVYRNSRGNTILLSGTF